MKADESIMMVMDPNTGRLVNVAPLFELTGSTSFEALAQEVDNAIRTIICYSNVEDFLAKREMPVTICSIFAICLLGSRSRPSPCPKRKLPNETGKQTTYPAYIRTPVRTKRRRTLRDTPRRQSCFAIGNRAARLRGD